ncbi:MAG: 1-phosphofructokinase [Chloroflexi bacterium]|nr:1-phosphofructokinase [Chloroflexota bacterium]
MKITTVSLNPAVDLTVTLSELTPGEVNYGKTMRYEPGGKAINVASFLADAGLPVTVTGFLGRENASFYELLFGRKKIEDRCVRIPGRTRVSVKIVEDGLHRTTDINLPGLEPAPEAVDLLLQTVKSLASASDWFVLSGSLPPGLPADFYAQIIHLLKDQDCRVILDTSGEALREGVQAGPSIIKPNLLELDQLTGKRPGTAAQAAGIARGLLRGDVEMVVVTMGSLGSVFVTATQALHAVPPPVDVKSTVGAGDAIVAGLLYSRACLMDLKTQARFATAFATLAITQDWRGIPDLQIIHEMAGSVEITEL